VANLVQLTEATLHGLLRDDIDPKKATAVGNLIKLQAALLVDRDLESRVELLEDALAVKESDDVTSGTS